MVDIDLDAAMPLGSLLPCPNCPDGLLYAGYDGEGEVDGYYCGTCYTGIMLVTTDEFDDEDTLMTEGLACDVARRGWWIFSDQPWTPAQEDLPTGEREFTLEAFSYESPPIRMVGDHKFYVFAMLPPPGKDASRLWSYFMPAAGQPIKGFTASQEYVFGPYHKEEDDRE